jgi:hypothetical protein
MSARVLAVTTMLLDLIDNLEDQDVMTPSEIGLMSLLYSDLASLQHLKDQALAEMQALAPAILEVAE